MEDYAVKLIPSQRINFAEFPTSRELLIGLGV